MAESLLLGGSEDQGDREETRTPEPFKEEPSGLNVVVGAGGPLGAAVAEILLANSRRVRAILFEEPRLGLPGEIETFFADPAEPASVAEGCRDGVVIYNCFEPSYTSWKKTYIEITGNITFAAIESGARAVFASHLVSSPTDNERSEKELLYAQGSGLTQAAIARLPQLYGSRVTNPLFKLIFDAVLQGRKAHWVGDLDVRRSYLDVGDAARAMVILSEDARAYGRAWNIASPGGLSGRELIELAFRAVGSEPKVGKWSRGVALTGSLLAGDTRLVVEMPYDYSIGFTLDGSEFANAFPTFSFTPAERTVEEALEWHRQLKANG